MAAGDEVPEDALPEEEVEEAEQEQGEPDHAHEGVSPQDETLSRHLQEAHRLDAPDSLSSTTEKGLHDRLHGTRHAEDR